MENRLAPAAVTSAPVQNLSAPVMGPALASNSQPTANNQANQGNGGSNQGNNPSPNQNNGSNAQPTTSQLANIGIPNSSTALTSSSGVTPSSAQAAFPGSTETAAAFAPSGSNAAFFPANTFVAGLPAGLTGLFSDNNRTGLGYDLTANIARLAAVGSSVPTRATRPATFASSFYPGDDSLGDAQSLVMDGDLAEMIAINLATAAP